MPQERQWHRVTGISSPEEQDFRTPSREDVGTREPERKLSYGVRTQTSFQQIGRHPSLPLLPSCVKKHWDDRRNASSFLLQARYNMETILIILLVLFLLGGGGFGYSRWRR